MKRLHIINFIGVLLLVAFCVVQWKQNRNLNLQFNALQKKSYDQAVHREELESNLKGATADLNELKKRAGAMHKSLDDAQRNLARVQAEARPLSVERDQLRSSVTNWSAAVALRDERLKQANAELKKLAGQLKKRLLDYNALASNHNSLVTNWNAVMKELDKRSATPKPNEKLN